MPAEILGELIGEICWANKLETCPDVLMWRPFKISFASSKEPPIVDLSILGSGTESRERWEFKSDWTSFSGWSRELE